MKSEMMNKSSEDSKVKFWILGGFCISLFFWVPLVDAFNVSKFSMLLVFGFLSVPVITFDILKLIRSNWKTYSFFLFFLLSLILNIATTSNARQSLFGAPSRFAGVLTYACLLIIAIGLFQSFKEKNYIFLVWTLTVLGAVQTFYAFLQVFDLDPISWNNPYGLIIGTVGNADFAGALIGICGVATLWLVYFHDLGKPFKVTLLTLILFQIYIVNKANIRQALIIFFIGITLFTLRMVSKKKKLFLPFTIASMIAMTLVFAATLQMGPLTSYIYKISISMRGDYWRAAIRMFFENPLTGIGLGNFGDKFPLYRDSVQVGRRGPNYVADAAHSVFLDFLSMGGIFLFFSYVLLLLLGFWRLLSDFKSLTNESKNIRIGFIAIWVSYLAQSSISLDQIGLAIWGWIFIGCALSFGRRKSDEAIEKKSNSLFTNSLALVFGALSMLVITPTWNADLNLKKAMVIGTQNRTSESAANRLQLLKDSTASDSRNSWYYQNAALILLQSGQIEGIDFAKKALELNPSDILSAKLLAMVSSDIGAKEESEKYARIVRELDPFANL